jgi:GNAT superfamily N-acetyltransferase
MTEPATIAFGIAESEPDYDRLARLLAAAFQGYPLANWLLGPKASDVETLRRLFRTVFDLPFARRLRIARSSDYMATAVWSVSEDGPLMTSGEARAAFRRFQAELGLPVARRLLAFHTCSEAHHPSGAHNYLLLLGVIPERQGTGLGRALLASELRSADAAGRVLVLETSAVRNLEFYRDAGFQITDIYHIDDDAPPTWVMSRDPVHA